MTKAITTYKGFDKNLQCRGFQFVVGQTYTHEGPVEACEGGFHACEHPLNVFSYYAPARSRFAVVEQSGDMSRPGGDTKVASRTITIKAEIDLSVLIRPAIEYTCKRAKPVDPDSPSSASGHYGAASATGYQGTASAQGDYGDANALALWDQSPAGAAAWVTLPPQEGWQVWIADEARQVRFTAGSWVEVPRPGIVRIRTLTATSHMLEAVDLCSILETTGSSAVTFTIPPEATVPFETGSLINITQVGAGVATVAAAAGVSLNGVAGGSAALDGPWSGVALVKRGADAWIIQGALAGAVA